MSKTFPCLVFNLLSLVSYIVHAYLQVTYIHPRSDQVGHAGSICLVLMHASSSERRTTFRSHLQVSLIHPPWIFGFFFRNHQQLSIQLPTCMYLFFNVHTVLIFLEIHRQ
ncbi:hypothetical protein GGR54DRAFT_79809 [Hypoxylon sp. NC1633]|nr:hypothetical protein GGR54DRAFT_79809 [Hypoxylon sp. NC1633]